jgi:rhodanese-related sulfurtransferase
MIPTLSTAELKKQLDAGEPIRLLDVRDTPDFRRGHIPGAEHLLIRDMTGERAGRLFKKDDRIVVYSRDVDCPAKFIASRKLKELGFESVTAYPGSWKEWVEKGLPIEP